MRINEDKCHLLMFGARSKDSVLVQIGSSTITNSIKEQLLGVILDSSLTFEHHVSNLFQMVSEKFHT